MGNKLGAQGRDGPENLEDLCKKYHFDKKEIKEWIAIFSKHCGDKKFLTQQEFCEVYNMTFCGDPGPFTKHVFRTFDLNKNGLVDVKEFLTGIGCSTSEDINTKLEWAFAVYDINGDGFITKAEIVDITYAMQKMINRESTLQEARIFTNSLFHEIGIDDRHLITKEEFCSRTKNYKKLLDVLDCEAL